MHKIFGQREKGQYYDRPGAYLVIFSGEKTAVVRTARGLFLLGGGIQGQKTIRNVSEENVWRNVDVNVQ